MTRRIKWFALFVMPMFATLASGQSSGCWLDPCPYRQGVGAVCRLSLYSDGSCYCLTEGRPPHQGCVTSGSCQALNPDGNGCGGIALTPQQKKDIDSRFSLVHGEIKLYMHPKCQAGPMGEYVREILAKRPDIKATWVSPSEFKKGDDVFPAHPFTKPSKFKDKEELPSDLRVK